MSQNGASQLRLNIPTVKALGHRLGLSPEVIIAASQIAGRNYSPFISLSKPLPFAINAVALKQRRIDNPVSVTKEIQKKIYRRLLRELSMPSHIHGGIKGKTLLDNITPHLKARVVVTLDIKSFFPHITTFQVYNVWHRLLGCSPEVAAVLTQLTTFERHLPQGAPTSSTLANLVLFSFDKPIRTFCAKNGIVYTTWIDDLIFSGVESRSVINIAVLALRAGGFSLPHKKLKIMSAGERILVTGVLVGRKPGVLRKYVRHTRAGIHRLTIGCVPEWQVDVYVRKIRGRIAHINRFNPNTARTLERQLLSVRPKLSSTAQDKLRNDT